MNLSKLSSIELLRLNSDTLLELKKKGLIRTANNPVADYAEWLVAEAFGYDLMANSFSSYDAIDRRSKKRYQVKSRRLKKDNKSNQLGVIRNLDKQGFDFLDAVIFNEDYSVKEAYRIPHNIINKYARYSEHQKGHILTLRKVLQDASIKDITLNLKKLEKK